MEFDRAVTLTAGRLEIDTGSVYTNDPVVEQGWLLQARTNWYGPGNLIPGFTTGVGQGPVLSNDFASIVDPALHVQGFDGENVFPNMAQSLPNGGSSNYWYDLGIAREAAQLHFRRMGPGGGTLSYGNQLPGDHYIVLGEREGSTATNADLGDIWFDAVFARSLADLDPTTTIGDEQDVP